MKVLSLFSGVGGLELGLDALGWETIAYSEHDPKLKRQYAAEVMAARYPDAPNLGDITKCGYVQGIGLWYDYVDEEPQRNILRGDIDVIAAGFPCQDISSAGKGAGIIEGSRSSLWSYYEASIAALRPRGVIIENVANLAANGLGVVLRDLAQLGYNAEWDVLSAAAFGAPHLRERMFIIAWPQGEASHGAWPTPPLLDFWKTESGAPRVTENTDQRVARLRCLGNAVVPALATHVGTLLWKRLMEKERSSGQTATDIKHLGLAVDFVGSKLPRAGRLTNGELYERKRSCPRSLKQRGIDNMAPTLLTRDGLGNLFNTPRSCSGLRSSGMNRSEIVDRLKETKQGLLPTPQASDDRDRGDHGMPCIQRRIENGKQVNLGMHVKGSLNPEFCEWMMGMETGWTDLGVKDV